MYSGFHATFCALIRENAISSPAFDAEFTVAVQKDPVRLFHDCLKIISTNSLYSIVGGTSAPTDGHAIIVGIKVREKITLVLLDFGASISCMTESFASRLAHHNNISKRHTK